MDVKIFGISISTSFYMLGQKFLDILSKGRILNSNFYLNFVA